MKGDKQMTNATKLLEQFCKIREELDEIFTTEQLMILTKCKSLGLTAEQIDLVANPMLNPSQMRDLINSILNGNTIVEKPQSQKKPDIHYVKTVKDNPYSDKKATIKKSQIISDMRYSPKQFSDVAKYSSCIPNISIHDIPENGICISGIYEDADIIRDILKDFGYTK